MTSTQEHRHTIVNGRQEHRHTGSTAGTQEQAQAHPQTPAAAGTHKEDNTGQPQRIATATAYRL